MALDEKCVVDDAAAAPPGRQDLVDDRAESSSLRPKIVFESRAF